jgi:hypothetical protein
MVAGRVNRVSMNNLRSYTNTRIIKGKSERENKRTWNSK